MENIEKVVKLALEGIAELDKAEDKKGYVRDLLDILYSEGKLDNFIQHIYDNGIKELIEPIEVLMSEKTEPHKEENDEEDEIEDNEELEELKLQEKRIEVNAKQAGFEEEIVRMQNQFEDYEVSERTKNSEIFDFAKTRTETLIYTFKELINNGCTYDNALAVAKDILDGYDNLTKIKLGAVQSSQNSI